jgi:hypothetical protein
LDGTIVPLGHLAEKDVGDDGAGTSQAILSMMPRDIGGAALHAPIRLDLRGALLLIEIDRKTTVILWCPSLFSQLEGRTPYNHPLRDTLTPSDFASRAPEEQRD